MPSQELLDEIEIVNAVYGDGSAVYKEEDVQVELSASISVDGPLTVRSGDDTETVTLTVTQLPPITVLFDVDTTLHLLAVDAVASVTEIADVVRRVLEAPTGEEEEETELMRVMNALHTALPAELVVQGNDTLSNVLTKLHHHNKVHERETFNQTSYDCLICLGRRKGEMCVQMSCAHVFCKICIADMMRLHINEGSIDSLRCASAGCSEPFTESAIEEVVGEELARRYAYLYHKQVAEKDPRTVHCPLCQTAVMRPTENTGESDEGAQRLRVCSQCGFTFCCYCRKTYHGPVSPCPVSTTHQFVRAYAAAPEHSTERLNLERRYGRKYLQRLLHEFVEAESNRLVIERTSQACPNCQVRTEKISGCNHMSCRCGFHFCYLCGGKLSPQNPYPHFNTPGTHCFQRLFDGVIQTRDDDDNDDLVIVNGNRNGNDDDDEGFEIQLAIMQIAEEHL
ncbi:hypothetical protein E3P99_01091 [Wallemia hederae]|uniref:RBR-type E3 ubiquitin transferase n=1 Tax=Wallemia hederae TaxID=1540922 RepID=A0A4T0FSA8_9BASI|nr:hypothetical protein E3P99_01091 [Wallemia hederae]